MRLAPTQTMHQAKRKQPEERRPPAQISAIFPVERHRVATGFVWRRIPLRAFGRAPFAPPVHRLAFARKAKAVTEEPALEHPAKPIRLETP
jgi:hypothetical protein